MSEDVSNDIQGLEAWLAKEPQGLFDLAACMARDEDERYPDEPCRALDAWGLSEHYIPHADGGRLHSLETLGGLLTLLARRDMSTLITHVKTLVGCIHHFVAGSAEQRAHVAALIRKGARISLAYHEEAHGSDHLAADTIAEPDGEGFRLSGRKWCINNLLRGDGATVFARTSPQGGPRGFSLFFVERARVPAESYRSVDPLKTLGLRGADFSGIVLERCPVTRESVIGGIGNGHEVAMRSFQLTRPLFPPMSIGCADTALRIVADFAAGRQVYGKRVVDIPHARRQLATSFADILLADVVSRFTLRAAHTLTAEMRLLSALGKLFVCKTVDDTLRRLTEVLGARFYLREGHWRGLFQKVLRDSSIISIFHAGGFTNLQTIGMFLLAEADARLSQERQPASKELLAALSLGAPLPPLDMEALVFAGRGGNPLLRSLDDVSERAGELGPCSDELALVQRELHRRLDDHAARVKRVAAERGRASFLSSAELFELSAEHATLHGVAAAFASFALGRDRFDAFLQQGTWLALSAARLLGVEASLPAARRDELEKTLVDELLARRNENRSFDVRAMTLAPFGP